MLKMKKRILFVDDDPLLLQIYTRRLAPEGETWEVATADSGAGALELMGHSCFDVVVSDMRMPGMDGLELAQQVRSRYPCTARIILSGIADQEEVARCLGTTHQFMAKPVDFKALKATLSRIGALEAHLRDQKLRTLVSQLAGVPSFPFLYLEIMKALSAEDSSIETIAGIVAKDPSMTAKVLQTVNSAVFGLGQKVSNPFEAVQFIGTSVLRSVVLSSQVFSFFEGKAAVHLPVERLWTHSIRTAQLASRLLKLEKAEPTDADDAYVAGMLHDLGKLMLAHNLPGQYQQAVRLASARKLSLHQAELEVFGATHAGAAAYLLGLWGLPAPIVEAVAFHHVPGNSDLRTFGPLAAVHVANVLEHEQTATLPGECASELSMDYLRAVGVQDRLRAWREELSSPQCA